MDSITSHIDNDLQHAWHILSEVMDPEIPVLSIVDLGVVRHVEVQPGKQVNVHITPTYSGCPAMDVIAMNIRLALLAHGFSNVNITNVLSPAWTTEWMSEEGKNKLKLYGIAPPVAMKKSNELFAKPQPVQCPLCESNNTIMLSEFGSTACKALYQCRDCREPFDVFKCH